MFNRQKKLFSYDFNGIDKSILANIIRKRLELAAIQEIGANTINEHQSQVLIKKYGDDYRAIINHLYKEYS